MKFLLIVTRREATGGNRIISDTVQPNFRPAYYYTLCALFHEIKIGKTEDLLLNIIFVLGTLGSGKSGPGRLGPSRLDTPGQSASKTLMQFKILHADLTNHDYFSVLHLDAT